MSGVFVPFFGFSSGTDAAEGVADNALRRDDNEELSEDERLGKPSEKMEEFCVRQRKKKSMKNQSAGTRDGRTRPSHEDLEIFWEFARVQRRRRQDALEERDEGILNGSFLCRER